MAKKISEFFNQTQKNSKIDSTNSNQDHIEDSTKNSEDDENICKFCGIAYLNLSMHIKKVHQEKDKNFSCKICHSKFGRKSSLNTHTKNFHSSRPSEKFECDFDGKIFKTKGRLYDHMKSHLPDEKCQICKKFIKFVSLKQHLEIMHTDGKNFKCKICSKIFKNAKYLQKHEKTHDKKFQCEICKSMQSSQSQLNWHIKLYHENSEIYKCVKCKKDFKHKNNLIRHQKTHDRNRPKPFKCHRCDFATDNKNCINNHQKSHERQDKKIATFKNPQKCEKCSTFHQNKKSLYLHIKFVHPKVQFQCDLCARFINAKSALKSHMKVHIRK